MFACLGITIPFAEEFCASVLNQDEHVSKLAARAYFYLFIGYYFVALSNTQIQFAIAMKQPVIGFV